ncbi:MAG: hypothetical protein LBC61_05475 [Candidatus Peribacteria bacterium]|nr:hypothetical protein [Candidatus Peribacteria bacterium]
MYKLSFFGNFSSISFSSIISLQNFSLKYLAFSSWWFHALEDRGIIMECIQNTLNSVRVVAHHLVIAISICFKILHSFF